MHPYKVYDMESRFHTTLVKRRAFPLVSSAWLSNRLLHIPQWAAGAMVRSIVCLLVLSMSLLVGSSVALASSPPPVLQVRPTSLTQTSSQCRFDGSPQNTFHCSVLLGETIKSSGSITWTSASSLSGVTFSPASGTLNPGQSTSVKITAIPCSASGTSGHLHLLRPDRCQARPDRLELYASAHPDQHSWQPEPEQHQVRPRRHAVGDLQVYSQPGRNNQFASQRHLVGQ